MPMVRGWYVLPFVKSLLYIKTMFRYTHIHTSAFSSCSSLLSLRCWETQQGFRGFDGPGEMRVHVGWREPAEERPPSPQVGFSDLCYHLAGFLQGLVTEMDNGGNCKFTLLCLYSKHTLFWVHIEVHCFYINLYFYTECPIFETSSCYWVAAPLNHP